MMLRHLSLSAKMVKPFNQVQSFIFAQQPKYSYHMSYLMDSKHDDRFVKIDRRAFHLYKDSIINFPN